jgi:hypothetical protein
MKDITNIITQGKDFVKSEFNLDLSLSSLKYYSTFQWNKFCGLNSFDIDASGLYVPKSYTAYVRSSPYLASNIFHELFGHGLFCEHSILGQELVKNELNDSSKDFLNLKNNSYYGLIKTNILDYEGFAIWMEYTLCIETSNEKVWNKKKSIMSKDNINLLDYFQSSENILSRYGLMAQLGFPKHQNTEKIVGLVKKLYADEFKNIDMIVYYGSKKPYSDIDLFIVSNNPSRNYFNGWLDIYELNLKDFEYLKNNLDISVTDPIFTGTQIYGQPQLKEHQKNILNQNITKEAITHNEIRAIQQKKASNNATDDRLVKTFTGYSNTYEHNAKELSLGHKLLTRKELQNITQI